MVLEAFRGFLASRGFQGTVRDIGRLHVRAFLAHLQAKGNSPHTVANRYRSLKAFFNWLVAEGGLGHSLVARVKHPKVPKACKEVFTREEVQSLLDACPGGTFTGDRNRAMMLVLLDSGVRLAELVAMRVGDVDFNTGRTRLQGGKGGSERVVFVQEGLVIAVLFYAQERVMGRDDYLFQSRKGGPHHQVAGRSGHQDCSPPGQPSADRPRPPFSAGLRQQHPEL